MEEVTCEEMFKLHKGLIYYYANSEGESSPLSREDIFSIANEVFMECFNAWDKERPFGKYFGTTLHYVISDARCGEALRHVAAPVKVKVAALRLLKYGDEGMEEAMVAKATKLLASEVLEGGLSTHDDDGSAESIIDTAPDSAYEGTEPIAVKDLMLSKMYKSFDRLTAQEKEVIQLILADCPHAEIGRMMGLSRQRVGQIYSDALVALKSGIVSRFKK